MPMSEAAVDQETIPTAIHEFAKTTLSLRPGFLIRRLHQIHLALFAEECAAFGVTPVQYSIMSVVLLQPRIDQASLGYEVGVDRATLTNVIGRLETKGLLRRSKKATDKRTNLVKLTARGEAVLEKMADAVQRAHARTIAPLPPEDQARFLDHLNRLVDAGNEYSRAPLRIA
jgi:DNA-binding MarR family transcriptional regulator